MQAKSIAIDGPAGAGKSTLARALAKSLGYLYVDTGAIYRTVALCAQRAGVDPTQEAEMAQLLETMDIRMAYGSDGVQHMYLAQKDVSEEIRTSEISKMASQVAALSSVRQFLLEFQRKQAQEHDVVMDGRDIGTVVLPQAGVKIFLTAAPEARARRRWAELIEKGQQVTVEEVLQDMLLRDEKDRTRSIAPLCQAEDAVLLDTTSLSQADSLEALKKIVREGLAG